MFFIFRQSYGCNHLTGTTSDETNGVGRSSLTESRYSAASPKHPDRRSMEYSRSQQGSRMLQQRQSNSRSSALVQSRTSKRIVQHQNSQSSLIYAYQHNR